MRYSVSSFTILVGVMCMVLLCISYELYWLQNEHMKYHHESKELSSLAVESASASNYLLSMASQVQRNGTKDSEPRAPVFVPYGKKVKSGFLKHVFFVFNHFGFVLKDLSTKDWDVLWAHDYPFTKLRSQLTHLKPHQRVNHFPGSGFITNKMYLATSNIPFVPKAFRIPQDTKSLLDYAAMNPKKTFVQKSNDHRGIRIEKIEKLDLKKKFSFVQEFIDKPLLVDGHKFDIGVYTIITSIDPLIVYIYNGDVLFRYCPKMYYPFDPADPDKYVIGDDYLPTWNVPSLKKYFVNLGYNMRESFNAYLRESGKNPDKIWSQVEEAIRSACLAEESAIQSILSSYPSKRNFFEMVRFDLVIDENLKVYIMEANMSPNLSSMHFRPNRVLYEQVLFNLFSLVGLTSFVQKRGPVDNDNIEVPDSSVIVYQPQCFKGENACKDCTSPECQLCYKCLFLSRESIITLKHAYNEHVRRRDCKRVFPPSFTYETANTTSVPEDLSPENQFLFRWFKAKCLMDRSWC